MTVGITKQFFESYHRLGSVVQKRAFEVLELFGTEDSKTGTKLEKLKNSASGNTYSIRVDQSYRIILGKSGKEDIFVALFVANHDDAYNWAQTHKFEQNPVTGVLQIFRSVESTSLESIKVEHQLHENSDFPIFSNLSDEDLYRLSVPSEWVIQILKVRSYVELEGLKKYLPTDTFEALCLIASGESFSEVLDLFNYVPLTGAPEDPKPNIGRDIHVPKSFDDLAKVLDQPLGRWRIFLHPAQDYIVRKNWKGPVRISGGPGTGKTVCVLHRAKIILESDPEANVLITSFDRFLALDLRILLGSLISPDQMRRVTVISLDEWAAQQLKILGVKGSLANFSTDKYFDIWRQLAQKHQPNYQPRFLAEEFESVILEQSVKSISDYVRVKRVGRGTRISGEDRINIFRIFEEFQKEISVRDVVFSQSAYDLIRDGITSGNLKKVFTHVLADEIQDFGIPALRLLSSICQGDSPRVFMVGDVNQRIRSLKGSFSNLGLNIRGRSRILRINYRTPRLVYEKAIAVKCNSFPVEDGSLGSTASLFDGVYPKIEVYKTELEEFESFHDWLQLTRQDVMDEEICIVTRTVTQLQRVQATLFQVGVPTYQIRGNVFDHSAIEGVRLSTIHRIKGLEFSAVAILGANAKSIPLKNAVDQCSDEETRDDMRLRELNAFFVAMTRTRGDLWISGSPDLTTFLTKAS
jgi:mRNA-degrading endonuclease RelE of RelBE toxin-antitoxin system